LKSRVRIISDALESTGLYGLPEAGAGRFLFCRAQGAESVVEVGMKEDQFNVVADLIRSQEPVRSAARKVLVEGSRVSVAARDSGVSTSSASNAVRRIRAAFGKVCSASPWLKSSVDCLPGAAEQAGE
jgi:hypothetical protein